MFVPFVSGGAASRFPWFGVYCHRIRIFTGVRVFVPPFVSGGIATTLGAIFRSVLFSVGIDDNRLNETTSSVAATQQRTIKNEKRKINALCFVPASEICPAPGHC